MDSCIIWCYQILSLSFSQFNYVTMDREAGVWDLRDGSVLQFYIVRDMVKWHLSFLVVVEKGLESVSAMAPSLALVHSCWHWKMYWLWKQWLHDFRRQCFRYSHCQNFDYNLHHPCYHCWYPHHHCCYPSPLHHSTSRCHHHQHNVHHYHRFTIAAVQLFRNDPTTVVLLLTFCYSEVPRPRSS